MTEPKRLALLCCSLVAAGLVAAQPVATLPSSSDLKVDGAEAKRHGKPLILFFSLPGCQFCHVVRQNYLLPLMRTDAARQRPVIRELDISSTRSVKGFDGSPATQHAIALQYGIRVAPTVVFVDDRGKLLVQPIIGGDVAGLYGGYLDKALSDAAKALSAAPANDRTGGKQ